MLSDNGYTPVEGDLNDGGKTYVMMGYKTTDDIRDSITDLAVMNMDGKYSTTEYSEVLKAKEQKVTEMLTNFMAAIFRSLIPTRRAIQARSFSVRRE